MKILKFIDRNWKYVAIYIVVVPIFALLTYIEAIPPIVLPFLILIVPILGEFDRIKNKWEAFEKRNKIEKRTNEFNKVWFKFEKLFEEDFLEIKDVGEKENLIEYAKTVIPPEKDVYLKIFYFYLKEMAPFDLNNFEKTILGNEITFAVQDFSLRDPTESNLKFAWGIYRILCSDIERKIDLNNFGTVEFLGDECFKKKFISKYVKKEEIISKLTSERKKLEDYRRTLSRLLESGKLDKYGIHKVIEGVNEEIEKVLADRTHYFILINELQHNSDIKKRISDSLSRDGQLVYSGSLSLGNSRYSLLLGVSEDDLKTKEFYERYIKESYESIDTEGWLSVHKAKFEGESIFKKRYIAKDPSKGALSAISFKNVLTTGEKAIKISLKEKLIETYLTTDELLSVLPLNLFLPDLDSRKKNILIENNENIKSRFGISKLTDWAYTPHTTKEIAEFLRDKYFPSDSIDLWEENVNKIVKEAKKIKDAIT